MYSPVGVRLISCGSGVFSGQIFHASRGMTPPPRGTGACCSCADAAKEERTLCPFSSALKPSSTLRNSCSGQTSGQRSSPSYVLRSCGQQRFTLNLAGNIKWTTSPQVSSARLVGSASETLCPTSILAAVTLVDQRHQFAVLVRPLPTQPRKRLAPNLIHFNTENKSPIAPASAAASASPA